MRAASVRANDTWASARLSSARAAERFAAAARAAASASPRARTSRNAGSPGTMRATTSPASTAAPGLNGTRNSLPPTGADTMYSFRTRVRPSSRTVTCIGPRTASPASTSTGCGRNAHTSSARSTSAAAAQKAVLNLSFTVYARRPPFQSLLFSTATRSILSSCRRTSKADAAVTNSTTTPA